MTIAVDAMGGDFAPRVMVKGAVKAATELEESVVLVGDQAAIERELRRLKRYDPERVTVQHCTQVAGMDESPAGVLRHKSDASIRVAWRAVREGRADAVVSAGHSGSTMACGIAEVGMLEGIYRPALAAILPAPDGPVVLLDVGANIDCLPAHFLQFAVMGQVFARESLDVAEPRVGLINIGSERGKGNVRVRQAYGLLENSGLPFVGNVEGIDVLSGKAEVLVCDGFVGNVLLKFAEGLERARRRLLGRLAKRSKRAWHGYKLLKPTLKLHMKRFYYAEYGGAPLLGLKKVGLVCHGGSTAHAVKNAIRLAARSVKRKMIDHLDEGLKPFGDLLGSKEAGLLKGAT